MCVGAWVQSAKKEEESEKGSTSGKVNMMKEAADLLGRENNLLYIHVTKEKKSDNC